MIKFVFILLITITFIPAFADSHPVSKDYFYEWIERIYNMFDWYENQISTLESENEKLKLQLAYYQNESDYNNHNYNPKDTTPEPKVTPTPELTKNPTRSEYYDNGNIKYYYKNNILVAEYYENGNFKVLYDDDGNLIAEYDKNGIIIKSTPEPIDYSKLCIDEYDNFKEPTIDIGASFTWTKSTVGSPISGSGINIGEFDSVILTIVGPDGQGLVYEPSVKSDGTFWRFMERYDMFLNQSLYGEYVVNVQYEDQCGMKTITYHR